MLYGLHTLRSFNLNCKGSYFPFDVYDRSEAKPNSGMKIEPGSSTSRSTMNERRETNESKVYPSSSKQNGIKVEPKDPAGSEDSRTQDGDNRTKESLLAKAPVVSFGVDLEHWENPDKITAPVKAR